MVIYSVYGGHAYICWGAINDVPDMDEVDPSTICQCTGLIDKNGELIWENDIVITPRGSERFVVEWSDTEARWQMNNDNGKYIADFFWSYDVEVIGNIFDNKDLLESE